MTSSSRPEEKLNTADFSLTTRTIESWENSEAARALRRIQANPRIKAVNIAAPADACPACQNLVGTYRKEEVPPLPVEACSFPLGCRSFYVPVIEELYP